MNQQKPLIGISCNYDHLDTLGMATGVGDRGQDWNYVAGDYVYLVEKAGAVPVLIPRCSVAGHLDLLLERLDGILLSGGHDVDPQRYSAFPKEYCGRIIPLRDESDFAVARYALDHDKPLLAICRGLQVLNVLRGGDLYQDSKREGGFEHHSVGIFPRNVGWHKVNLTEGSRLKEIFGAGQITVNSYHHQAIRNPGDGVTVTALSSSDGLPDGIELDGYRFAIGVQWHPEMMFDSDIQLKLARAFVDACR